jgi:nucleoside-diphosphate-sugar epimerase
MKVLFIGGSGQISFECVHECVKLGYNVSVFNRGMHNDGLPKNIEVIKGNFDDFESYKILANYNFDVICQFRAFVPEHIQRDIDLFQGKVGQYVFISSASAYKKPPPTMIITEDVPLVNKYAAYSQNKADCETVLKNQTTLPYTIVRPSHTLRSSLPTALAEREIAAYRILNNKPIIVPGDGTSLWTLTHARDFAPPFAALLGKKEALGEAYHLTGPNAYRWDEIYQALAKALGVENIKIIHVPTDTLLRYNPEWTSGLLGDKAWTSIFDNTKIKKIVGNFECKILLDELMTMVVYEWEKSAGPNAGNDVTMNALMDRIISDQEALGNEI